MLSSPLTQDKILEVNSHIGNTSSIVVENNKNLDRSSKNINQDYISQQLISFQGAFE
jgi:hypothetical protein